MAYHAVQSYIANREIPQLFESLMAGLMYHRPEDHISYVQECLRKIKLGTVKGGTLHWNTFINSGSSKSRELPPVSRQFKSRSQNKRRDSQQTLPPISDINGKKTAKKKSCSLYHCTKLPKDVEVPPTIVFLLGLQPTAVSELCKEVNSKNSKIKHVNTGDVMKSRLAVEGFTDLRHVPPCAIIDGLVRALSKDTSGEGTVLLITEFPRSVSDCEELKSSKLGTKLRVVVLDDREFVETLEDSLKQKRLSKPQKILLEEKHALLQDVVERYQPVGEVEVAASNSNEVMAAIDKLCGRSG